MIHDQAIYGVEPEGKVKVDWHYETFSFPDGDTYELARPTYTITDWYKGEIAPEDLFCTVRIPLRHVGMGQMMALDPNEIEALAKKSRIWHIRPMQLYSGARDASARSLRK